MVLVEHFNDYFDPEDGSAIVPDCFGVIDAVNKDVTLEQTSCNLGKSLKLRRQDNRIGPKQLIVIVKNPTDGSNEVEEEVKEVKEIKLNEKKKKFEYPKEAVPNKFLYDKAMETTKEVIKFFKE